MAAALVRGGATTLEMLANDVDDVDIAGVLGIPVEEARVIRNRRRSNGRRGGPLLLVRGLTTVAEAEPGAADES